MLGQQHSAARAREFARRADLLMIRLHVVIQCRCCVRGSAFEACDPFAETLARADNRSLARSDFIGLLEEHDLDPTIEMARKAERDPLAAAKFQSM